MRSILAVGDALSADRYRQFRGPLAQCFAALETESQIGSIGA